MEQKNPDANKEILKRKNKAPLPHSFLNFT